MRNDAESLYDLEERVFSDIMDAIRGSSASGSCKRAWRGEALAILDNADAGALRDAAARLDRLEGEVLGKAGSR
jgi:hypothetical protein